MPYRVETLTEYALECDCYGKEVVFHSGAVEGGNYAYTNNTSVESLRDAFKAAKFRKVANPRYVKGSCIYPKYIVLCDECFNLRKNK
ncbi:MAG: hypothetical protein IIT65_13795 [Lachnospiraceae bacterium]|nr:hypothetical protein [Lachnospiraceae bacterium]